MNGQTDVLRSSHMRLQQRCHDAEAYVERLLAENMQQRDALRIIAEHSTDDGSRQLAEAALDYAREEVA